MTRHLNLENLGTKDGLTLWMTQDPDHTLLFLKDDKTDLTVGYMLINPEREVPGVKNVVGGIYLKKPYRSRGLGTVFYLAAIRKLKALSSDGNIGLAAVRTWRSLEKYGYRVRLWCTSVDQEFNFTWGPDSIPVVDGVTIAKQREQYVLFILP